MIETVVKRDGTIQVFDPSKLNGWGLWASRELDDYVDWTDVVLNVVATLPKEVSTETLQNSLIDYCLTKPSWAYNRMAGRLYVALLQKQLYENDIPTIKELFSLLVDKELMSKSFFESFSNEDYEELEFIIDHNYDLNYAHYQIKQSMEKYSLKDRVDNILYETPQFSMLRVAMRMCLNKGVGKERINRIKRHYNMYRLDIVNIPTPYYTNSGTTNNGLLSCCLHTNTDTIQSLATSDHISYMMTAASAGIGAKSYTRAIRDKVRGGSIEHQGRRGYLKAQEAMINANMQNGRGGAETQFFDCIDIEAPSIVPMKNPMTPLSKQVRGLDYSFCYNTFFMKCVATNEPFHLFSFKDHPELFTGLAAKDDTLYQAIYEKAVAGDSKRLKVNARDFFLTVLGQSVEVGQMYTLDLSEVNRHTPFIEAILQSNLCLEIALVTKPYKHIMELYKETYEEGDGEVAVCAIAGISQGKLSMDREESEIQYKEAAWVALDMIHTAITETDYPFPQVKYTALQRMSAGVGIIDLAHDMARHKVFTDSQEGLDFVHKISERHYWHLLNASLELSKEFGNAGWMHKTLWPKGWLPLDTYNKNINSIVTIGNQYDWEEIRQRIIKNKGHAFSVLVANMPAESSSIKTGTTNSVYDIRDIDLKKGNDQLSYSYVVPDSDTLKPFYKPVWDIELEYTIKKYGILQKWADQMTSADLWYKAQGSDTISSHDLLRGAMLSKKYGVPSRYYLNTLTGKSVKMDVNLSVLSDNEYGEQGDCEGCKL